MKITDEEMDLAVKAIKYGLVEENPEYCYIKVLNKLIKKVNIDESFVKNTFELLVGHSQFIHIMLNRDANQAQKGILIYYNCAITITLMNYFYIQKKY